MVTMSHLFMFRSSISASLRGFAGDAEGAKLPQKFGPWNGVGVVRADQIPPHGLSRKAIDLGIAKNGYQLWRDKSYSS